MAATLLEAVDIVPASAGALVFQAASVRFFCVRRGWPARKPRQHLVDLSVHLSRPCWIGGRILISMIGLSHDEDTFCLYAAPLLVKPRPTNRVKILFTKMGSEGDLIGSANSIQINPSLLMA